MSYDASLRRNMPPKTTRPVPSKTMEPGSGVTCSFSSSSSGQSCLRKGRPAVQAEVHDLKAKMGLANPVEIKPPRFIDTPWAGYALHR